ncbi:TetR/AcrR family transcriptional regulator [Actinomadura rupiterrae]|uniref:TetR/AcrR family transcriptional regulator n=1 Tax=Actinomadura rupiterrae TaxID=559627 RepID=UPI0020A370AB|nr:TetR/AcrR family transcriptional regulator [Actinomadura rupiterrae]MCP2341872.1 AcrR family transcriptional regulator [Actinomadura rupiterrae]
MPLSRPERRAELFDAVLALLAEVGYERLTMDLVAKRARAGKASLYQRWPSKAHLVVAAMERYRPVVPERDAGSFLEDIRQLLTAYVDSKSGLDRGLLIALLEGSRRDPELARLRRERLAAPVRRSIEAALDRARARGEIPDRVDAGLLADLPFAVIFSHALVRDESPDPGLVDRFVDGILAPLLDVPNSRDPRL